VVRPGSAWPCTRGGGGHSVRAHVNANPGSDIRRSARKYDVKITSQSQTGLARATTHRGRKCDEAHAPACPADRGTHHLLPRRRRRRSEFDVSTSRQNDVRGRRLRPACDMQIRSSESSTTVARPSARCQTNVAIRQIVPYDDRTG